MNFKENGTREKCRVVELLEDFDISEDEDPYVVRGLVQSCEDDEIFDLVERRPKKTINSNDVLLLANSVTLIPGTRKAGRVVELREDLNESEGPFCACCAPKQAGATGGTLDGPYTFLGHVRNCKDGEIFMLVRRVQESKTENSDALSAEGVLVGAENSRKLVDFSGNLWYIGFSQSDNPDKRPRPYQFGTRR